MDNEQKKTLGWPDLIPQNGIKYFQNKLKGGNALIIGKDLRGDPDQRSLIFTWFPGHELKLNPECVYNSEFSPEFPNEWTRERNLQLADISPNIKLRLSPIVDGSHRIFVDRLSDFVQMTEDGKLETHILLLNSVQPMAINVIPRLYRPKEPESTVGELFHYWLDIPEIPEVRKSIVLEEWDYTKESGVPWHLRKPHGFSQQEPLT